MPFIREQIEANAGGSTVGTYTIETGSVLLIHFFRNEKLIIDKTLLRQLYNLPGSVEWNP